MQQASVLQLLRAHRPFDNHEQEMLERLTTFVSAYENFYARDLLIGHVTASAWIVDENSSHALLVHHGKLNMWVQPGGHIEDDVNLLGASLREAREETGLHVQPLSECIFDVDIHSIPARPAEPAHFHYDIRFLLRADKDVPLIVTSESKDLAWAALGEIENLTREESVLRMARKTLQQY